jgi:hypothetical protein
LAAAAARAPGRGGSELESTFKFKSRLKFRVQVSSWAIGIMFEAWPCGISSRSELSFAARTSKKRSKRAHHDKQISYVVAKG